MLCAIGTVAEVGASVIEVRPNPVPETGSSCGLPVALSSNRILANLEPATDGVNCTFTVQLCPALSPAAQLWVSGAKSAAFAPERYSAANETVSVPVLVTVTVTGELTAPSTVLSKLMLAGDIAKVTTLTCPLSAIKWVPRAELSVSVMLAVRTPAAVGAKAICMVQLAPGSKPKAQVWVSGEKSLGLEPVSSREVMFRYVVPLLVSVITCCPLEAPMAGALKLRLVGEKIAV